MIKQGDRVMVRTDNFLGDIIEGGNPDYYGTVISVYRSQYGEDVRINCDNGTIATVPSYRVEIQN